jgi:hypothetical protein
MNLKFLGKTAVVLIFLSAGCANGGGGGDGGGGSNDVAIDDAQAQCDSGASAWDDLFVLKAWTAHAASVTFTIKDGGTRLGEISLDEEGSQYWYREVWADDLGTDCDEFNSLRFIVEASGENGSTEETELR